MSSIEFEIDPLVYQSGGLKSEWLTIFTLCLAPLIAHIVAGVPQTTYLHKKPPKWHQRLYHYNPTSIIWRYAMIADRWIRCGSWDSNVIAATNALFWTSRGWDGSEGMIEVSFKQCLYLPEHTRVPLFSSEMFKTLIVTAQGVQATYTIISGLLGSDNTSAASLNSLALDTIFFPLAVMGLLRLVCAFWLTNDYAYAMNPTDNTWEMARPRVFVGSASTARLLEDADVKATFASPRMRPVSYWPSMVFRVVFLLPLLGLLGMPVLFLTWEPWAQMRAYGERGETSFPTTVFVLIIFYLVLFAGTFAVISYQFVRGRTSTVLPCIDSVWYKAYSAILLVSALGLFTIACIETRMTVCGRYTAVSGLTGDELACTTAQTSVIGMSPGAGFHQFGIASTWPTSYNNQSVLQEADGYWVYNFTGTCLGSWNYNDQIAQLVQVINVTNVTTLYGSG